MEVAGETDVGALGSAAVAAGIKSDVGVHQRNREVACGGRPCEFWAAIRNDELDAHTTSQLDLWK